MKGGLVTKTYLIIGGAGSLGRCLIELLKEDNKVRAFDINEAELAQLKHPNVRLLYGSINDKDRLKLAMQGVNTVIHTAALKNLEISEFNIPELIKTNINGTLNVAEAAMEENIEKTIFISSDKAVDAKNAYGVSKHMGEKIILWANKHKLFSKMSIVRPGNFWRSRGNVFEIWDKQKEACEQLTVTDPRMERYFISVEDVSQFILKVEEIMKGGEIFIPKMKLYNILKLAKTELGDAPVQQIKFTGIREGEKLVESLWSEAEASYLKEHNEFWVI